MENTRAASSSLLTPPLKSITVDDLTRHFIRHLYAIAATMDPRELLNFLHYGEGMFLLDKRPDTTKHLCTKARQSLLTLESNLLSEEAEAGCTKGGP